MADKYVQGNVLNISKPRAELLAYKGVIPKGLLLYESDTNKAKMGDGVSNYANLPYIVDIDAIRDEFKYTNTTQMLIEVGGYKPGQTFDHRTLHQIFDGLFYPYVAPVINSMVATPTNGGAHEYGVNLSITGCTVNVTKKARDIKSIVIKLANDTIATKSGAEVKDGGNIVFDFDEIAVISPANPVLTAYVTDIEDKTYQKSAASWTWLYPYYHGVVNNPADELQPSQIMVGKDLKSKGNKSYSYTTDNNMAMIAYPKSFGLLKSILDPNSFESISDFTYTTISLTSSNPNWTTEYYVYTGPRNTNTNFQYTFKY